MRTPNSEKDNKSCKATFLVDNKIVTFTGDFDSGNLERVEQLYGNPKDVIFD